MQQVHRSSPKPSSRSHWFSRGGVETSAIPPTTTRHKGLLINHTTLASLVARNDARTWVNQLKPRQRHDPDRTGKPQARRRALIGAHSNPLPMRDLLRCDRAIILGFTALHGGVLQGLMSWGCTRNREVVCRDYTSRLGYRLGWTTLLFARQDT